MNGEGRLQRAIRRAFTAYPGRVYTTAELVAWCHPGGNRPGSRVGWSEIRSAARGIAEVVGRTCPGGFLWRAIGGKRRPSRKPTGRLHLRRGRRLAGRVWPDDFREL
jgi:hypothetical protein